MEAVDMEMVRRVWQRVRTGLPEQDQPKRNPKRKMSRPGYRLEQMLLAVLCLKYMKK